MLLPSSGVTTRCSLTPLSHSYSSFCTSWWLNLENNCPRQLFSSREPSQWCFQFKFSLFKLNLYFHKLEPLVDEILPLWYLYYFITRSFLFMNYSCFVICTLLYRVLNLLSHLFSLNFTFLITFFFIIVDLNKSIKQ